MWEWVAISFSRGSSQLSKKMSKVACQRPLGCMLEVSKLYDLNKAAERNTVG